MTERGAIISDCGQYRYRLWRTWDASKPIVGFIMLNPSTADAEQDDPTIRRCIGFAKSWGYGGLEVGNVYAYRATDPRELLKVADPYGPVNLEHLFNIRDRCELLVAAWGARCDPGDGREMIRSLRGMRAFGFTANGSPKHPLYLPVTALPTEHMR